jgi:methionyl-tRNA formyltransferase
MDMCENIIKTSTKNSGTLKNCDIVTPNKLNPEKSDDGKEFYQRLKNKEPDLLVVIAYGKIIPQAILDIPKIAPINIHGSLLPKYRGASPIQSIFLNNDKET